MGPIDLVVCDLAGTTVDDSGGAVLGCLVETARAFELPGTPEELNAQMGMSKREVFGRLAHAAPPDDARSAEDLADAAMSDFLARMSARYERELVPIPGAEDTFRFLRGRGIKIALDTGFDRTILNLILDRLAWLDRLVDFAICGSEVRRGRPAPYMIFRAMECLEIPDVRRVMKIGDSPADLEEGMNAGCREVIGVLSGAHTAATLGPVPHTRLISSVADLPALFD
jgi:phosphonatase-like hydrolase